MCHYHVQGLLYDLLAVETDNIIIRTIQDRLGIRKSARRSVALNRGLPSYRSSRQLAAEGLQMHTVGQAGCFMLDI